MEEKVPVRSERSPETCWAVEDIFPSEEAWQKALEDCRELPKEIAAYEGRLGESAKTLLTYLERMEEINRVTEKLYVYAFLRLDEDTTNSVHQAMRGRCFSFVVELSQAGAFEAPEPVAIDEDTLNRWYEEEPGLNKYRRYLTQARLNKKHVLSPAEEALLAGASELGSSPSDIFNAFDNADLTFPTVQDKDGKTHELTNGTYISLMTNSDRQLRANTFETFYETHKKYENTLATAYNAEVKKNIFFAKARKYDSALAAALEPNEVPVSVYENLVTAVRANLDQMHRYMALRKKIMHLDELHMYDIYADMLPSSSREISFEQAKNDVLEATKVLGEEYHAVLERSFREHWMDIYENKGKRSGAYSCGCPDVHPFVLLNHKNNLDSEFTLVHEMGHAMHSYLSDKNQPPIYSDYVLFVAEVASLCNEALLMQYLLGKTTEKQERAVLINHFLEQFRTTLYRQTMFAEFEWKAHQQAEAGETLTAESLNAMYYQLNKDYYGEDMVIDQKIEIEWARIPHFYRNFYVYQYATGFAAAMALSTRILKEGEPAVKDYLKFLSGGCSTDPVSLLKIAGVDMSTPKPVNDALKMFGELITEMETLVEG